MVVTTCNKQDAEAEPGGASMSGQPRLHSELKVLFTQQDPVSPKQNSLGNSVVIDFVTLACSGKKINNFIYTDICICTYMCV